jgi:peptide/nickel transport system substrate-binding protein
VRQQGVFDIAAIPATADIHSETEAYMASGVLARQTAHFGTFGYIGINAERINADGEPLSEASINFRKGIAVILGVYRDISVINYHGGAAVVAEYPVSGVSWAAPRPGDADYRAAFSLTVRDIDIYSPTMTETMRIESAKRTALDYFEAAGCELNITRTAIVSFPEDMEAGNFEVFIDGKGMGDHPSFVLLTMALEALREMNINITIRDVLQEEMFEKVINGTADMWCAAWHGDIHAGLEKTFMSTGNENFFGLASDIIDTRISVAYASLDPALYKNVMEAVLDTAVIVPVYQRQVYYIFGTALAPGTIESNLTSHYSFTEILWRLELND